MSLNTTADHLSDHTREQNPKFDLVKDIFVQSATALLSGSSESAQWRATLQVSDMQQELHPAGPPAETLFGSHGGKASRMQGTSARIMTVS